MTSYRFETSETVRFVEQAKTSKDAIIAAILKDLFPTSKPLFTLEISNDLDDDLLVVKRVYRQDFEKVRDEGLVAVKKSPDPSKPSKPRRKRRWRSPEPLLDIVRRRFQRYGRYY